MSRSFVSSSVTTAALVGLLYSSPAFAQAPPEEPTPRPSPQEPATPPAPDPTPTPPPPPAAPTSTPASQPGPSDDDEGTMVIKASRKMDMQQFSESSQQELKIAGA